MRLRRLFYFSDAPYLYPFLVYWRIARFFNKFLPLRRKHPINQRFYIPRRRSTRNCVKADREGIFSAFNIFNRGLYAVHLQNFGVGIGVHRVGKISIGVPQGWLHAFPLYGNLVH